jgi:hypothetical protein
MVEKKGVRNAGSRATVLVNLQAKDMAEPDKTLEQTTRRARGVQ